jgi:hypothetical protein
VPTATDRHSSLILEVPELLQCAPIHLRVLP